MGNKGDMWVVVRDGWIPDGYFDSYAEADAARKRYSRLYQGWYTVERCDASQPRRYMKAITTQPKVWQEKPEQEKNR